MTIEPGQRELENLRDLLAPALAEDLGDGDVTGALLPDGLEVRGQFAARQELVVCGAAMLATIAGAYDDRIETTVHVGEGRRAQAGQTIAEWRGASRGILAAERVALNFLQRLAGVATATRRYVDAVAGTGAAILDTRKTTPGWRCLEKYAVRCGGGTNHRMGLYDAVLVKDNHLAVLAGAGRGDPLASIAAELESARRRLGADGFVEVEVDTMDQLATALTLCVDVILLDNMTAEQMRSAVAERDQAGLRGRVKLEASGGITLDNVRQAAETGVERIAIGALTHSAAAVDIGLDVALD